MWRLALQQFSPVSLQTTRKLNKSHTYTPPVPAQGSDRTTVEPDVHVLGGIFVKIYVKTNGRTIKKQQCSFKLTERE